MATDNLTFSAVTLTAGVTTTANTALGSIATDIGSVTAVSLSSTLSVEHQNDNSNDDTYGLNVRIRTSGGTILAAATAGGGYETLVTAAVQPNASTWTAITSANVNFTYVNTGATQTDWNSSVIEFEQTYTRSMADDAGQFRVNASTTDLQITYDIATVSDDLLADDVQSLTIAPNSAIGQLHALTATDVQSASIAPDSAVAQLNVLLADNVNSLSNVTTPSATETNQLNTGPIESVSQTSSAAIGQAHVVLADDVNSASNLTAPAVGQSHVLAVGDINSSSNVTAPALSESAALLADNIQSASNVTTPTLAGNSVLLADNVQSDSNVTTPSLAINVVLLANDVQSATNVTTPALAEISGGDSLLADDVQSASNVTAPAIGQKHVLTAISVASLSQVSTPNASIPIEGKTILKLKRSLDASQVPSAEDLEVGEIAQNLATGELWTKDSNNNVKRLGGLYWSAATQRPTTRSRAGGYAHISDGKDSASLPTSDPEIDGAFWNDNGVLKVSDG